MGIAFKGNPPVTLAEDGARRFDLGKPGDDAFEKSHAAALAALAKMQAAMNLTADCLDCPPPLAQVNHK